MSFRRITLLLLSLLPLVAACFVVWVAYRWQPGAIFWAKRFHPVVVTFVDGRAFGFAPQTMWMLQWKDGEIALVNAYAETAEEEPYEPPPGFPYDPELARQIRGEWDEKMRDLIATAPTFGYETDRWNVADPEFSPHWWQRRGLLLDWPSFPNPPGGIWQWVGPRSAARSIACPAWALAVLSIAPLLAVSRTIVRRLKTTSGKCLTCGYDLRASHGLCPECGTPVATGDNSGASGLIAVDIAIPHSEQRVGVARIS